ncbi:hypothetical protein [Candidatus Hodarchaeum mangrovi]
MISRSTLTTIIGFLFGVVIYLSSETGIIIVFLTGGVAYFIGLILEEIELKQQHQFFSFSNLEMSEKIFYPEEIPGAMIIYSFKENRTTVIIDFRVDAKPQNFRLSVVKNLTNFEFRVSEDAFKTIFNLTLDFPNLNYLQLIKNPRQLGEFHLSLKERLEDFKTTLLKVIPGLVISAVSKPGLSEFKFNSRILAIDNQDPPSPPKSPHEIIIPNEPNITNNKILDSETDNFNTKDNKSEIEKNFDLFPDSEEEFILEDLNQSNEKANSGLIDPEVNIPIEEVQNIKNHNNTYFNTYLEKEGNLPLPLTTSILSEDLIAKQAPSNLSGESSTASEPNVVIDFSKVQYLKSSDEKDEKFDESFINRLIEEINKKKDENLCEMIQKEKSIINENY